ncbi:pyridoxamine 5'-phosphate oxidase [Galbibacter sp. EGI 63066]|uniref:pyridoxamine 5'-phosphate oxidase n=1 Tax=Galbibacter sp. EGI 63066 TaxID=2993559 RepID=UPI002248FB60|nr:pyridoxamine 5'-phosphate oxidase [Galbibacter sp. EGI 63066]MCX2680898.1 pyridoxamine 5'-phosphate oxidase [Galbibacter sp. EGI 63066]
MENEKDLSNYRKVYEKSELIETNIPDNPIPLFQQWFDEVETSGGEDEANTMTISTIGLDGFPKNRVVLLKRFTAEGFVFYTNYNSEKGKALVANPNICASFFWPALERQVIIKGKAEKVEESLSDTYFASRPKGSQLGAVASQQSEVISSREVLEKELGKLETAYKDKDVPRPKYWGGYNIAPISIEFWQGRPNRLHDRIRYTRDGHDWRRERLSP